MGKYAIIFPCTRNYLHEARPLLKSFLKWEPDIDIHITTVSGKNGITLKDICDISNSVIVHIAPECDTEFRAVRTYRFYLAKNFKEYSSVCLLDADMVLFRPINKFFRLSSGGPILVCADSTILRYTKKHFEDEKINVDINKDIIHPFFSTVPTFINPNDEIACKWIDEIWNHYSGNDLSIPNMIAAAMDLPEKHMIYLNSYQWTNIHHSMLKPETFVRIIDNKPMSHQGQYVYMIHGHWQDDKYCNELLIDPLIKNYGEKVANEAKKIVSQLRNLYNEYLD